MQNQQSEENLNTNKITVSLSNHLTKEDFEQNKQIEFLFITTRQHQVKIMYYSDKPMSELIKLYFEKIGHLDLFGSDKKKSQQAFGLFSFMNEQQNDNNSEYTDEELDNYGLEDWQKEEVKKGNYDPWNFEEEDLDEDDYYKDEEE